MNGILVVNKPCDHTSHDVVARLRGILHQKRIGHGGTLDPMAVGVLPILVGRATRASEYLLGDKEYVAEAAFGVCTDSQDHTGQILETSAHRPSREELLKVLDAFRGDIMQIPPMVSAVKIGGRKLYELHRRGVEIERPARPATIHELILEKFTADGCTLRVRVSKGTYIRTLIHDIGLQLGCLAVLTALTRTVADPFTLAQALTLEEIGTAAQTGEAERLLLPVDSLFAKYPAIDVSGRSEVLCRNGNSFPLTESPLPEGLCRVYAANGDFLLLGRIGERDGRQYVHTEKSFFEVNG